MAKEMRHFTRSIPLAPKRPNVSSQQIRGIARTDACTTEHACEQPIMASGYSAPNTFGVQTQWPEEQAASVESAFRDFGHSIFS
jgi:hypothetical protein